MTDLLRQEIAALADTVVVKVGTRVLTDAAGKLDRETVASLAEQVAELVDLGRKVVVVSSGAVGAGLGKLGLPRRPTDIGKLQAVAAVGQSHLMQAYEQALSAHGRHAGQVLLTADGLDNRARYLNARNTILELLAFGAVPIINENDTTSVEELQLSFGDNDRLAAIVTNLIRAPLLILLSDVEGLFDRDPADPAAQRIATVSRIDEKILALALDNTSGLSKGGMASKLAAARIATTAGEAVIIASGRRPGVLGALLRGEPLGTLFLPEGLSVRSRKRWIGFAAQSRGTIVIDEGACRAIAQRGSSLLAIGVVGVEGEFSKGDLVSLSNREGIEYARGLSNYSADEVRRIRGLKTGQIAAALGHCPYREVIHRDNMTVAHDGGRQPTGETTA